MTSKHTFSILAYKESLYLQDCIDSLKKQIVPSEIILCTSTPSAFLEDIANQNSLRLCINPHKNGIADDWNFALNQATTPYVTLAHQDDIYFQNYSKDILASAEIQKDALIIFSNYNEIIEVAGEKIVRENSLNFFIKRSISSLFFRNKNHLHTGKKRLLAFGSPIGCPSVTYNKNNLGNFSFDKNFGINLDWKAWYDLAQKDGSFVWVKKILMSHRIYAGSETSQGLGDNRRQKEDLEMFEKFWPKSIAKIIYKLYSLSYKSNNN